MMAVKSKMKAKGEMRMYSVYLVDDEKWSLCDVLYTFPFGQCGFEVVGQNTNALAALDAILDIRPAVVFADIRMPSISGLDLIHMVKQQLPETVFVILSGYAEFEYAVDALRMEVFDYCLKPIDEQSAQQLLIRLKAHLDSRAAPEEEEALPLGGSPQFTALLQYVNDHITEPLALGELAQRFYINISYCGELFRNVTGENFTQYVRRRRLQLACSLLRRTNLPLSQVASRVGYPDLPYFSRVFTAAMGVSPSRYRAAEREKQRG